MNNHIEEEFDIIVVGAGHAGCEAALASARLGLKTVMFTVSVDSIALMPCNPNIGGTSKGHLVCELDALGGEMGKCIDKAFIQTKMLNVSKGPAVHSLRAQADKQFYIHEMRKTVENTDNLYIKQAEVSELITEENDSGMKINGVITSSGAVYKAKKVVLCTGVYLNARCIYGDVSEYTGPNGLRAANDLTKSMMDKGISVRRFKTGTPARVDSRSIDFSKMEEQKGDEFIRPFSFTNDPWDIEKDQVSCWLTYTNENTHNIIRDNIDRSPLYSGDIKGTGPRYCPSIEDKVMKFPDKERHQIFIEPEGLYTNEMYLSGLSSSLPEDVQHAMVRSIAGLENAQIVRNAYAIEYDCIDANQLKPTLEFKNIEGLYSAGQINGSSGYEEAAVQGFMAGVNASRAVLNKNEIILDRSDAYIGVLIDDLVTKESFEPYRMMTSRAEYRLLLRQDNADIRLRKIGHDIGLVSDEEYKAFEEKLKMIADEISRMELKIAGSNQRVNDFLKKHNSALLESSKGVSFASLIRRPELNYDMLSELDDERSELPWRVREQVNIEIKYEGYIKRQLQQVKQFKKLEGKKLPKNINYKELSGLRIEAQQKLNLIKPENIGQAGRISGVSPADISVLLIYLEQLRNKK